MGKIAFLISLIGLAFFVLAMYIYPSINTIAIVNLASFLFFSYAIYKKQKEFLTPLLLVLWSLYIFHSGHLWISFFKVNALSYLLDFGYSYSESELIDIYRMLTVLLIIFGCTGLRFAKRNKQKKEDIAFNPPSWMHSVVIILYIIMMYFEVERAGNVSVSGYGDGYHYSNSFALMLSDWVNMLLITMMFVYRNNPKIFWRYTNMLLIRALFIMFFVGNRGSSVIQIITAVFIISRYSYLADNKVKLRQLLLGIGAFLLVALPLISIIRSGISSNDAFSNQGPVESFLIEFGDTARNTFLVDDFIHQFGDVSGQQMLSTSLTILPMSTILWGEIINQYGLVGAFLNDFYNIKGLGGSMFAQLYFNFGNSFWLYLSTVLMALLTTWVSNTLMTNINSIYKVIIFLGLFVGLMTNVRSEWYSTMSCLKISLYLCVLFLFLIKKTDFKY